MKDNKSNSGFQVPLTKTIGLSPTEFENEVLKSITEANHPDTQWLSHDTLKKNQQHRFNIFKNHFFNQTS